MNTTFTSRVLATTTVGVFLTVAGVTGAFGTIGTFSTYPISGKTCTGYPYGYDYGYGYGYGYNCVTQTPTPSTSVSGGGGGGGGGGSSSSSTPGTTPTPSTTPQSTPRTTSTPNSEKKVVVKARDIAKSEYKSSIEVLIKKGLVDNKKKFTPERSITRAEFIKILANAYGFEKKKAKKKFKDVDYTSDLALYIDFGVEMGWINVKNDEFRPDDYITLGEAQKLLDVITKTASADTIAEPTANISRGKAAEMIVETLKLASK